MGQRSSIVGKAFALHVANTKYVTLTAIRSNP